jgi:hypothetical protein
VTNRPEGFGKRMILARVYNEWGSTEYKTAGYIQDLRIVIARFMGRDEPRWNATDSALLGARRRPGEWFTLDGGALRVRGYLKGTAHLEVHPEMAWRLNCVLAQGQGAFGSCGIAGPHGRPAGRNPALWHAQQRRAAGLGSGMVTDLRQRVRRHHRFGGHPQGGSPCRQQKGFGHLRGNCEECIG